MSKLPFDRILAVDAETAWGRKIDLGFSSQTNEEYIRDPRFKAWGLCWNEVDLNASIWQKDQPVEHRAVWVRGKDIAEWAKGFDWSRTAVVAHNAQFDVTILSWLYGIKPAFIFDTLSMGRALRGVEVGNSLKKLAEDFELPPKGTELASSENYLDELPFEIEMALADYCRHDVWLCEQLFLRMLPGYPSKELRLIDLTLRMYTEPWLELDKEMLTNAIEEERHARQGLLTRLGVDEAALASNEQFAAILEGLGIEAPTKVSKTTGKRTLALAKNDAHFQALLNSDDENLVHLCEARLAVKSTMQRTRAQRFLGIAERGRLPFPVTYFGAVTGRYTAAKGSQINMQNLKRGSFLRKSIMAPDGYLLAVADLSQIEPRVLAYLSDYTFMIDVFKAGGDPYATFGAQMFNIPGMTKDSHPVHRQSAKSALLGCGFQLGWASFAAQLLTGFLGAPPLRYTKDDAKKLGVKSEDVDRFLAWEENVKRMLEIPHTCTDQELLVHCLTAKAIIDKYRATAQPVVAMWSLFQDLIPHSLYKGNVYRHKCLTFKKEEIVLPSGMSVHYPDLQPSEDAKGRVEWSYWDGKKRTKLYAGKITNNCLAKGTLVLTDSGWIPIEKVRLQHRVHDGVEFVQHDGKVFNGVQACVTVDGVAMTPDHLVLTDSGWEHASQVQRPYRPDLRHVEGVASRSIDRQDVEVALLVRLWQASCKAGVRCVQGSKARWYAQLRVHDAAVDRQGQHHARHVEAPRILHVAQHAQPLLQRMGDCVQKLRGAWYHGVRAVGYLRSLLGGYGGFVLAGAGVGSDRQQRTLRSAQLSLGCRSSAGYESAQHNPRSERACAERRYWDRADDAVQPHTLGLAAGQTDRTAVLQEPVYDIMNCGPRHRFVVLGNEGPFVVHNCVQGTARCVMTDGMLRIAQRYPVVGTVHDEALAIVPEADKDTALDWMIGKMTQEPAYLPGIPLAADGGTHKRYGLAKN